MAYAIIRTGGKQYRVTQGEIIQVPMIAGVPGDSIEFEVLARGDGETVQIGSPAVEGTSVTGTIVDHGREKKLIVFRKKRRKQYKKKQGHRQGFTMVKIETV